MSIPAEIVATGFDLPESYARACDLGLGHIAPWQFLQGEAFLSAYARVNEDCASGILLPFARRADLGELACFEVLPGPPESVRVLAEQDGHAVAEFPTFWAWFRQGVEDMIHQAPGDAVGDLAVSLEWFERRAEETDGESRIPVSTS